MKERRQFLRMVAAGPAGALLLPLFAQTGNSTMAADIECVAEKTGKLPENIIYCGEHQGVWKGKAGSHVPTIDAKKSGSTLKLTVETKHGMSEGHYIVRHTVVADCGQVLGAKTFHWSDKPISTYEVEIPKDHEGGSLYVMSFCNKHDLWLLHTKLSV